MFAIFCAYLLSMQADQVFHNSQFRIVQQVLGKFAQTCFRKLRKNLIIARNYFRNLLKTQNCAKIKYVQDYLRTYSKIAQLIICA